VSAFQDHFSAKAAEYAKFRPRYPAGLFDFLGSQAPARRAAWDCATGSGQVAEGLSARFEKVYATDASAEQIRHAPPLANVSYRVEPAESSSLQDGSVDLVTVGQALHWLDLDRFYDEVRRVARPGALVVAWCYNLLSCGQDVDGVLVSYYRDVLGPYWPADRVKVESGYKDLPFPFSSLPMPQFALEVEWNLADLMGYLGTWSAAQRFRDAQGKDPREVIADRLAAAWLWSERKRRVTWALHFRIGRV